MADKSTPKPRYGTPPIQFRLTAVDLAQIDAIAKSIGTASRAEAVRYAVRELVRRRKLSTVDPVDEK